MRNIKEFSTKTIDNLSYYVYVYSDPDTHEPFYVGKGKGNRVFNHMSQDGESEKIRKIKAILDRGKEPIIEILVHGIDEVTALKVEAAAIDLIGIEKLTNAQRGHHVATYGRIDVNTLNARYACEELTRDDITENVLMIRVNKFYRNTMTPFELYDLTRCCWKVNKEKADKVKYVLSVYEGMVLEVYSVLSWLPGHATLQYVRAEVFQQDENRYEFIGNIAPSEIQNKYKNKSVANLFNKGEQNPIKYFLNEDLD